MRLLVVAAFLGLFTAPALAENFNVDPDMDPADIQDVIDAAADGDTVKFAKGVYLLTFSLTLDNDGVTLKGSKAVLDGQYMTTPLIVTGSDTTVTGFIVVNAGGRSIHVKAPDEGPVIPDNVTISSNRVEGGTSHGIDVIATNATVTKNRVGGCGGDGMFVSNGAVFVEGAVSVTEISRNQVVGCDGEGMTLELGGSFFVEKNTVVNNGNTGILVTVGSFPEGPKEPPVISEIAKNKCIGNDGHGIRARRVSGDALLVEKNTCHGNASNGIEAEGDELMIVGNKCDRNLSRGIVAEISNSLLQKNKAQLNRGGGLYVTDPSGETVTGDNMIDGNMAKANGNDGLEIDNGGNTVTKNKCLSNVGDGIDVNPGHALNDLDGNTCNKNGHEGIDNGSSDTKINNNKCKGNGTGLGPDIAGTGDAGLGSVAADEFNGNSFDTGGADVSARLDSPGDA